MPDTSDEKVDRTPRLVQMLSERAGLNIALANRISNFVELLARWNNTYRLVGSADSETIFDKHIHDALILSEYLNGPGRIVDLGAGAGLPAIPLSIIRADLEVVMVEPQLKRVNFCNQARRELNLKEIQIMRGRAEDSSVIAAVGQCRWVLSRATWKLEEYLSIAKLYHPSESILALKGKDWRDELPACCEPLAIPYETPISKTQRNLLVF